MWRYVVDRPGGYAHAVPSGLDAPTLWAVCLRTISSATAVDADERVPHVCAVCRALAHDLARLDAADRPLRSNMDAV
ncbi:MAG TPA: hypothetical protein VGX25_00525 [Actinophytocola sp.]|uniref:hypothetical protein n=1 Tax=Actinophytocola sp. TaxID=1872138 RepID=UPI002DDC9F82|nr:hypothetical protein [Actinophytocola sp.]HEV2777863.1 hypothetical protein [Actinophytocola sp.]